MEAGRCRTWHDDIGAGFFQVMQNADAFLLGRRTYEIHANAFEPMPAGDPFGDLMNTPKKYVVSRTLTAPIWRDTTIIRDDVVAAVRSLKAQPGKDILTDGSSQLVQTLLAHDLVDELYLTLYPVSLGGGKRILPEGVRRNFRLTSATPIRPVSSACATRARNPDQRGAGRRVREEGRRAGRFAARAAARRHAACSRSRRASRCTLRQPHEHARVRLVVRLQVVDVGLLRQSARRADRPACRIISVFGSACLLIAMQAIIFLFTRRHGEP